MSLDFIRNTKPLLFDGIDKDAFEALSQALKKHGAVGEPTSENRELELLVDESVNAVLDFMEKYSGLSYPNKVTTVCRYFTFLNTNSKTKNTILDTLHRYDWGVYSSLL